MEVCTLCGHKVRYNVKLGRIDNAAYGRAHFRDILQPEGATAPLYERIYGKEAKSQSLRIRELQKRKNALKDPHIVNDLRAYAQETLKTVKSLESKGKL